MNIDELLEEASKLADSGKLQSALDLYTRILSEDDRQQEACVMAGAIHGELGRFAEAERLLRQAQDLSPQDMAPFLMLSHMLRMQGKKDLAIENLKHAVKNGTNDAEVFCLLGSMQHEAGLIMDAIDSFKAAHRFNNVDRAIKDTLTGLTIQHADALEKSGDHEASFELVRPLLESGDPPLDAVLVLAKLSPIFDTFEECRRLLHRFQDRGGLTDTETSAVEQALIWLAQTEQ